MGGLQWHMPPFYFSLSLFTYLLTDRRCCVRVRMAWKQGAREVAGGGGDSSNNWKSLTMLISHASLLLARAHTTSRLSASQPLQLRHAATLPAIRSSLPIKQTLSTFPSLRRPSDRLGERRLVRRRRRLHRTGRRSRDFLLGFTEQSLVSHGHWPLITIQTATARQTRQTDRQTDNTTIGHLTHVITTWHAAHTTMFYHRFFVFTAIAAKSPLLSLSGSDSRLQCE